MISTSELLLLKSVIHGMLYIYHPYNTEDVFVRFNRTQNGSLEWNQMKTYSLNGVHIKFLHIPINSTAYQLQLRFPNYFTENTVWYMLSAPNTYKTEELNNKLLVASVLCSSAVVGFLLIKYFLHYGKELFKM